MGGVLSPYLYYPMKRKTFIPFGQGRDLSFDYIKGILEDARITTLQRIDKLDVKELHWQYHPEWNSISVLLEHMISCDHLNRIARVEQREITKEEQERFGPGMEMGPHIQQLISDQPVSHYIARLTESRALLYEQIDLLEPEAFQQQREGYNPETGYNIAWVLAHVAEDEVHHRGQISILRKLYLEEHRTF